MHCVELLLLPCLPVLLSGAVEVRGSQILVARLPASSGIL